MSFLKNVRVLQQDHQLWLNFLIESVVVRTQRGNTIGKLSGQTHVTIPVRLSYRRKRIQSVVMIRSLI